MTLDVSYEALEWRGQARHTPAMVGWGKATVAKLHFIHLISTGEGFGSHQTSQTKPLCAPADWSIMKANISGCYPYCSCCCRQDDNELVELCVSMAAG